MAGDAACATPSNESDAPVDPTAEAPTGARPAPEGNEFISETEDDQQESRLLEEVRQLNQDQNIEGNAPSYAVRITPVNFLFRSDRKPRSVTETIPQSRSVFHAVELAQTL